MLPKPDKQQNKKNKQVIICHINKVITTEVSASVISIKHDCNFNRPVGFRRTTKQFRNSERSKRLQRNSDEAKYDTLNSLNFQCICMHVLLGTLRCQVHPCFPIFVIGHTQLDRFFLGKRHQVATVTQCFSNSTQHFGYIILSSHICKSVTTKIHAPFPIISRLRYYRPIIFLSGIISTE